MTICGFEADMDGWGIVSARKKPGAENTGKREACTLLYNIVKYQLCLSTHNS